MCEVRGTFHRRVELTLMQWQLALPQRSDQLIQLSVGIAALPTCLLCV